MTSLLSRLFIKDRNNTADPRVRRAYGTMVAVVGTILNLLLAVGKYTVGFLIGSIAMQADAVNNLSDAGSQIISFVSFRIAARPADHQHPFGHARVEYIASMIVSFIVLNIGLSLLAHSVGKIIHPSKTLFSWWAIGVMGISILVKLWLFFFNRRIAKRIDSQVMRATAADSLSDAGATLAVTIAMLVHKFTGFDPDAYMGILVAGLILWAGIGILRDAMNSILGERPSEETVSMIRSLVSEFDNALGVHDLIVHNYGPGHIIASLHIEVDGDRDVYQSHDMIDLIERRLRTECGIEATVHMDPISIHDPRINALRTETEAAVQAVDPSIHIHDFRVVPGDTHTNLIFDIAAPYALKRSNDDLRTAITARLQSIDPDYFPVITIDRF